MVLVRPATENHLPIPTYDAYGTTKTIEFYFGGEITLVPRIKLIGAFVRKFDYVQVEELNRNNLELFCKSVGFGGKKRFYSFVDRGLSRIKTDRQLREVCLYYSNSKAVPLYVKFETNLEPEPVRFFLCEDPKPDETDNDWGDSESEKEEMASCEVGLEDGLGEDLVFYGEFPIPGIKFTEQTLDENSSVDSDYVMDSEDEADDDLEFEQHIDIGLEGDVISEDEDVGLTGVEGNMMNETCGEGELVKGDPEGELNMGSRPEVENNGAEEDRFEGEEYEEEDVVTSKYELDENKVSDEDIEKPNYPTFNPIEILNPTLKLGMLFSSKKEWREAIHSYAVNTQYQLDITKNGKDRMYAKCGIKGCKWKCHALRVDDEQTFQIRVLKDEHSCPGTVHNVKNLKSKWLSKKYLSKFRSDPNRKMTGFRLDAINELKVHITKAQAYKAKRLALAEIEGTPEAQFAKLWDYAQELRRSNPGSTVILGTDEEQRFDRFYVCFKALKDGFKSGCRPFIGVDGCHLKGPHGGVLLTAVGVDPNNSLYPIAYAVVCKEDGSNWEWFLTLLKTDLNIGSGQFTFMSDKQKGLIMAMQEVFPQVDHRFCVRHLHGNFKNAGYTGLGFRNALWEAAIATTVGEFKIIMKKIVDMDQKAADWLSEKPAEQWSKSHFKTYSKCDLVLNNVCESFNGNIMLARERPILTMLEWIREYLMRRLQENRDYANAKWRDRLCPKIMELVRQNKAIISQYLPMKCDNLHYQITSLEHPQHQYVVDLGKHICTCRAWQLSGFPCAHALCAIANQKRDTEEFIDECYSVDTYKKVYEHFIMGISGDMLWDETCFIPPLPPNFGRRPGRPGGARRRGPEEPVLKGKNKNERLKRRQITVKCSVCAATGHNSRSCPVKKARAAQTSENEQDGGAEADVELESGENDDGLTGLDEITLDDDIIQSSLFNEEDEDYIAPIRKTALKKLRVRKSVKASSSKGVAQVQKKGKGAEGQPSQVRKSGEATSSKAVAQVNKKGTEPVGQPSQAPVLKVPNILPPTSSQLEASQEGEIEPSMKSGYPSAQMTYTTGPTMYQQLQMGQAKVNLRIPPPMVDSQCITQTFFNPCESKDIFTHEGRKYLSLSSITQISQVMEKGKRKTKD